MPGMEMGSPWLPSRFFSALLNRNKLEDFCNSLSLVPFALLGQFIHLQELPTGEMIDEPRYSHQCTP